MSGPIVQMPASISQMLDMTRDADGKLLAITVKPEWASFFSSVQAIAAATSRNGSTTARPTDAMQRYEGMPFFDRTLGHTVWLKHASSNVWVDATGAVV